MASRATYAQKAEALLALKRYPEVVDVCERLDGGEKFDFHGMGLFRAEALVALKRYEQAREAYSFARFTSHWAGGSKDYRRRAETGYRLLLLRMGRYRELFETYQDVWKNNRRLAKLHITPREEDDEPEDWVPLFI